MTETISYDGEIMAIIIPNDVGGDGVQFYTPNNFSQQLAHMAHPAGKIIPPHTHNSVSREVFYTQEVLIIRKGQLRVDFYTRHQEYLESRILSQGDVILLASGGHGFQVLEDIEMIEVKQGPYLGENDKVRFTPIDSDSVVIDRKEAAL